jgi:SAM-dependent methyltransferase
MEILPDWYQTWFDSPFYHILYKHRDEEEAKVFLDNLLDFLKPAPGGTFLDMACGKGRHSLYLNTRGYDVTGIDLSARSIEYASSFENEHLSFFVHDMRNLFRTNYFDFVLNLFTSFGYFDKERDNVSVIDSAAKSLKKGGFMVLDYMNCNKAAQNLREEEAREIEGIVFRIKRSVQFQRTC